MSREGLLYSGYIIYGDRMSFIGKAVEGPQFLMQINQKIHVTFLCLVFLVSGCASVKRPEVGGKGITHWPRLSDSQIKASLQAQQASWRGVRYRLGGMSKSGIDCSGFILVTFRDKFGINLPRSTQEQALIGAFVQERDLQVGALVFFKTAPFTRHVGVYIGDRRFLHASTSRGVIVSDLDNPYWKTKYWTSRRL